MSKETEAKSALERYLSENYTPTTITKVVEVKTNAQFQETNAVYEEEAKAALEQFLNENKRTQIVVVSADEGRKDCGCPDDALDSKESVYSFSYEMQKLFDKVHMRTSYVGRSLRNKETGESQLDEVAVTLDEWDIFFDLCKEASVEVYSVLSRYSRFVDKAFLFNAEDNKKVEILFAKRERSFDFNLMPVLDTLIETAIFYYIVAKWFETIGLLEKYSLYWGYFEVELENIRKNSRNLKMRTAKRRYRFL